MYYLVGIILLCMVLFEELTTKKINRWFYIGMITVVTSLRFGVGADYFSYEYIYNSLNMNFSSLFTSYTSIEIGFRILMYIGRLLHLNYHVFISLIAVTLNIIVISWFEDNDRNIGLGLLLYYGLFYFSWTLNAIRQAIVFIVFSYLYFNKKYDFSKKQILIIILILSSFHLSALILIPFIYLIDYKFEQKHLLIILGISLLITFIPVGKIMQLLPQISLVKKASSYFVNGSLGFIDAPGLVRLVMFLFVLYHYNILNDTYDNKVVLRTSNIFLLSLVLYFCLKSTELLASRISVYGYFTIIFLLPLIVSLYSTKEKSVAFLVLCGTLGFSTLGIYKEINATIVQSGYLKSAVELNQTNIFNYDRFDYLNKFNHLTHYRKESGDYYDDFFADKDLSISSEPVTNENIYTTVKIPDANFGVIDNKGEIIEKDIAKERLNTLGPWMVHQQVNPPGKRYLYNEVRYRKIGTKDNLESTKVWETINPYMKVSIESRLEPLKRVKLDHKGIENTIAHQYFPKDVTNSIVKINYNQPIKYEIIEISVYGQYYYVVLNGDGTEMINKMYNRVEPFNDKGIMIAETYKTRDFINMNGEIIWMEKK